MMWEVKEIQSKLGIIAGVLCSVAALVNVQNFLVFAAYIVLAVGFFINKRTKATDILTYVGIGILEASSLFAVLQISFHIGYWIPIAILAILIRFLAVTALLLFVLIYLTQLSPQSRETWRGLFFVPAIISLAGTALSFVRGFIVGVMSGSVSAIFTPFGTLLIGVICAAAFYVIALRVMELSLMEIEMPPVSAPTGGSIYQPPQQQGGRRDYFEKDVYVDMVPHVLLLFFTFSVWYYIWIYRKTRFLNCLEDEPVRDPVVELLLCMFIPFYAIYWHYKTAQRIDKLAQRNGIASDITVISVVVAIFFQILVPIFEQERINAVVMTTGGNF